MEMSEPLFGISSTAKIDFYLIRVKFIRMLCNMFKQIQLIISFLQEFFNGFIQIFNILTTSTQFIITIYQKYRRQISYVI